MLRLMVNVHTGIGAATLSRKLPRFNMYVAMMRWKQLRLIANYRLSAAAAISTDVGQTVLITR
jgi:hypothetical protein